MDTELNAPALIQEDTPSAPRADPPERALGALLIRSARRHDLADLDNKRFAIYKMMPFASSSDVTRQRLHVEDRPDRSWGGARVTNVWLARDFPETFRRPLRGHVTLLAIGG